jgi:hypothetical protein
MDGWRYVKLAQEGITRRATLRAQGRTRRAYKGLTWDLGGGLRRDRSPTQAMLQLVTSSYFNGSEHRVDPHGRFPLHVFRYSF